MGTIPSIDKGAYTSNRLGEFAAMTDRGIWKAATCGLLGSPNTALSSTGTTESTKATLYMTTTCSSRNVKPAHKATSRAIAMPVRMLNSELYAKLTAAYPNLQDVDIVSSYSGYMMCIEVKDPESNRVDRWEIEP